MYILQKRKVSFAIRYLSLIEFREKEICYYYTYICMYMCISSILTLISFFESTYNHINETINKDLQQIYFGYMTKKIFDKDNNIRLVSLGSYLICL